MVMVYIQMITMLLEIGATCTTAQWLTYEMVLEIGKRCKQMYILIIGWYLLFMIMYMAGYDKPSANESLEYTPKRKRGVTRMIARSVSSLSNQNYES